MDQQSRYPREEKNRQDLNPAREQKGAFPLFEADLECTRTREGEIAQLRGRLDHQLALHALKLGNFNFLVGKRNSHYLPFFDIGILPDSAFKQDSSVQDVTGANLYFASLVGNPIGRIVREEFPNIGDAVSGFVDQVKEEGVPWMIPRHDSPIVRILWDRYSLEAGIFSSETTTIDRAKEMLRLFFKTLHNPEESVGRKGHKQEEWWFVPEPEKDSIAVPLKDRLIYGALLFCALGERLHRDWKSNEVKFGYTKPHWEAALKTFLASTVTGAHPEHIGGSRADQEGARTALEGLQLRYGISITPIIQRLQAGADVKEFFEE